MRGISLLAILTLFAAMPLFAAVYTYTESTSTTTEWSAGTSWDAIPVGATNTTLNFTSNNLALPAGTRVVSDNDIPGNFQLNRLNFTYQGPASGTVSTVALSGNPWNSPAPVRRSTTIPAEPITRPAPS